MVIQYNDDFFTRFLWYPVNPVGLLVVEIFPWTTIHNSVIIVPCVSLGYTNVAQFRSGLFGSSNNVSVRWLHMSNHDFHVVQEVNLEGKVSIIHGRDGWNHLNTTLFWYHPHVLLEVNTFFFYVWSCCIHEVLMLLRSTHNKLNFMYTCMVSKVTVHLFFLVNQHQ